MDSERDHYYSSSLNVREIIVQITGANVLAIVAGEVADP